MSFGVLTLATAGDYRKAIGLALSVRVSNPGVPIAVACAPNMRDLLAPYFDHLIDKDPSLFGYVHKIHLDRYSPFEETFFFDSGRAVIPPFGGSYPTIGAANPMPPAGTILKADLARLGLIGTECSRKSEGSGWSTLMGRVIVIFANQSVTLCSI